MAVRLSVCTFNLWGHVATSPRAASPERRAALLQTVGVLLPDVLLLQELSPEILDDLDVLLGGDYDRVRPAETSGGGWQHESQIFFRRSMFTLVEFGLEQDVGFTHLGEGYFSKRGLFWARLMLRSLPPSSQVLVSTAHLPWVGGKEECETGVNPRICACLKIRQHLATLLSSTSSTRLAIFGGDLNEDFHPVRVMTGEGVGEPFTELYASLDMPAPPTHPVRPSDAQEEARPARTLDWLFHLFASTGSQSQTHGRVVSAMTKVPRGRSGSDHLPVVGVYELP